MARFNVGDFVIINKPKNYTYNPCVDGVQWVDEWMNRFEGSIVKIISIGITYNISIGVRIITYVTRPTDVAWPEILVDESWLSSIDEVEYEEIDVENIMDIMS